MQVALFSRRLSSRSNLYFAANKPLHPTTYMTHTLWNTGQQYPAFLQNEAFSQLLRVSAKQVPGYTQNPTKQTCFDANTNTCTPDLLFSTHTGSPVEDDQNKDITSSFDQKYTDTNTSEIGGESSLPSDVIVEKGGPKVPTMPPNAGIYL